MKKWVEKLIEQFDFEWSGTPAEGAQSNAMNEDRATLLFMIDNFNKHLIEVEGHPVRKTREILDEFAKELIQPPEKMGIEKVLFRFRQFFSAYRIDETTYFQKTFEDFRTIIWDFVDQLSEDIGNEKKEETELGKSLNELKDAVESNSIDLLKDQSRKFIDQYIEGQFKKDKRRSTRMKTIRKNFNKVKKQLGEATSAARTDHLTGAYNRKTFDETCQESWKLFKNCGQQVTMILVDIDHFKKINDTFGHQTGDWVLKNLVTTLHSHFGRESDFVARIGGEEFGIILPDYSNTTALKAAEDLIQEIRDEIYVVEDHKLRFTVSCGIAQLCEGEDISSWLKRADTALYHSKNTGRNRATVAQPTIYKIGA